MKDFKDLVMARRSVRAYSAQAVEEEKLQYILDCVQWAPSACNKQPWHFIIVRSDEAKSKLRACYPRDWFATAPLYILALADHATAWTRQADGKQHTDLDLGIAIEHLVLAATEQGLSSCWVCAFDADLCRKSFELPDTMEPVAIIPIGYAGTNEELRHRTRKPLADIISEL